MHRRLKIDVEKVTVVVKSAPVPMRVVVVVGQSQGDVRVVHLYQRRFGLSTSEERGVICNMNDLLMNM